MADKSDENEQYGQEVELASEEKIPQEQRFMLWVAAGARCAFCKRYLLENEETGDPVLIGEMAHIVGRKNSTGSPRGKDNMPLSERNKAHNLVLVCSNNHTVIDKKRGIEIWETDDLRRLKKEHEAGIKALTAMTQDRETTILRVGGRIAGTGPVLSKDAVLEAVHADLRFPQYRLGHVGADIEVDLASDLDDDDPAYFHRTDEILGRRVAEQIGGYLTSGDVSHLSVFAFARIPVLVQLGHYLDDKWPVAVRQYDRVAGSWKWQKDREPPQFEVNRLSGDVGAPGVTLICALSGHTDSSKVPPSCAGTDTAVYEMRPVDTEPGVQLFCVEGATENFANTYVGFLAGLERDHPSTTAIDVIPAIGLAPAVELGRRRTRAKHPRLRIWELRNGEYRFATEVGA